MADVKTEIWTGELLEQFRYGSLFLNELPDYSDKAENDVIHLTDVGADPGVTIGNIPVNGIPSSSRTDVDVPISLLPFRTDNTTVSEEELYALSYDKIASVTRQHVASLEEATLSNAAWNLSPDKGVASTPLFNATGSPYGQYGFKAMTFNDIIDLDAWYTENKVPLIGRVLVLNPQHLAHLIKEDRTVMNQVMSARQSLSEGFILYNFKCFVFGGLPKYNKNTSEKNPFMGVTNPDDFISSISFYAPRMFKARGTTFMRYIKAENDTKFEKNSVGFTQRFIAAPKKVEAMAAILSKP